MLSMVLHFLCAITVGTLCGMELSSASEKKQSASVDFTSSDAKKRKTQADGQAKNSEKKKRKMLAGEPEDDMQDTSQVQTGWQNVPAEVIAHIVAQLCNVNDPRNSIKELKKLELVSKELKDLAKAVKLEPLIGALAMPWQQSLKIVMKAVASGDLQVAQSFIQATNDLAGRTAMGSSFLLDSGRHNNKLILKELLAHGALNCSNNCQRRWLSAVILGEKIVFPHLASRVSNGCTDDDSVTALMYAASNGDNELVALLAQSQDVNSKDGYENTALMYAARNGHEETVKLLLQYGATINDYNECGYSALAHAALLGYKNVVTLLLNHESTLLGEVDYGLSALHAAAYSGDVSIAQLLIERGAEINVICQDVIWPDHNVIRPDYKMDLEPEGTPLMVAAGFGHKAMVEFLLKNGADIAIKDRAGEHALSYTCTNGDMELTRLLVEHGAPIDQADDTGNTPLYNAVGRPCVEIVEFLVKLGAAIDQQGLEGYTPLMRAIESGNSQIVELLLSKQQNLEIKNEHGETALSVAVSNDRLAYVEKLIAAGADINTQDVMGRTAIWHAFNGANIELIKVLMTHHADTTITDYAGTTVLDVAIKNGLWYILSE